MLRNEIEKRQFIDETDAIPCVWQRFRMNEDRHLKETLK